MGDRILTILIIEDDIAACTELSRYIEKVETVKLLGITSDTNTGIKMVQSLLPDVVILDIELNHGTGNGLSFLMNLNELNLDSKPYILVTTNNSSNITFESAHNLGADFIMAKYKPDYSAQYVIEFLRMIQHTILTHNRSVAKNIPDKNLQKENRQLLIRRINRELDMVGISPKNIGYDYLSDAILLLLEDPTANVYKSIAMSYKKSDASVERAMQNAINRAWRHSNIEELLSHYTARVHSEKGVPSTLEFVHYYVKKIKTYS